MQSTWFADWGPLVDVVGYCFLNLSSKYRPREEFVEWINKGPKPIYIGFGSMVRSPEPFSVWYLPRQISYKLILHLCVLQFPPCLTPPPGGGTKETKEWSCRMLLSMGKFWRMTSLNIETFVWTITVGSIQMACWKVGSPWSSVYRFMCPLAGAWVR